MQLNAALVAATAAVVPSMHFFMHDKGAGAGTGAEQPLSSYFASYLLLILTPSPSLLVRPHT